jgi:uncharacterized RDD family membrane protein YckC
VTYTTSTYVTSTHATSTYATSTYATWGRRVVALLVDLAILLAMVAVVYGLSRLFHGTAAAWFAVIAYTIVAAVNFYNKCVRMGRSGQTWGKQLMGFGLIREQTGKPMGLWRAVVRELAHALDYFLLGIGFLLPLWDRKRQTFADKIMKTVAVDYSLDLRAA